MVSARIASGAENTSTIKVVFAGPMGAGKTTAIGTISDIDTVSTEVPNHDLATNAKAMTTVGLDYGETALGDGAVLQLYGTPGQERFRFMWDILADGAFGVIVLVDNAQPDPVQSLDIYLNAFLAFVPAWRMVVGVGRTETHPLPSVAQYCRHLAGRDISLPVLAVDVRRAADVRLLLTVLISNVEVAHE